MSYNALCRIASHHVLILFPMPSGGSGRNWEEAPRDFTLYGGTAIALRLGHRQSIDFDFFAQYSFEPDALLRKIPYLNGAIVRQSSPTL